MKKDELLAELKRSVYQNAVRLFRDSCILCGSKSFPSAFAFAVLSYEELGKVLYIDRVCDSMCLNPEIADEIYDSWVNKEALQNHQLKQAYACSDGLDFGFRTNFGKHVASGNLDQEKKSALYVEFDKRKIKTPNEVITEEKAKNVITVVLDTFDEIKDVGYNGFECFPTAKSEWLYQESISEIREIYSSNVNS